MNFMYTLPRLLTVGIVLLIVGMPLLAFTQSISDEQYKKASDSITRITKELKQKNLEMTESNAETYEKLRKEYTALQAQLEKHKKVIGEYNAGHRELIEVKRLYNEGQRLAKLGKFDQALLAYDEAIKKGNAVNSPALSSTISNSYYMKGYAFSRKKKTMEAIEFFKKAVSVDPNNAAAYYAKANAHAKIGQRREAIANYRKAIDIDPMHFQAYLNLGTIYYNQKKLAQAEEMFRKSSQSNAKFTKAKESLGQVLVEQRKYSKGIKVLIPAVKQDRKAWKANWFLARAYNGVGQPQNAIVHAEKSVKIHRNGGAYIEMGDAYLKLGDSAKAKQSYNNALRDRSYRETAKYKIDMMENKDKYVD